MKPKKTKHTVRGDLAKLNQLFNEFNDTAIRVMSALDLEGKGAGYCSIPKVLRIQQTVADHFRVPMSVMTSLLKPRSFVDPRHVAMTLCVELTSYTTSIIGMNFNRHHSSVIYAQGSICERIERDATFATEYKAIRASVETQLNRMDEASIPTTPLPLQFQS